MKSVINKTQWKTNDRRRLTNQVFFCFVLFLIKCFKGIPMVCKRRRKACAASQFFVFDRFLCPSLPFLSLPSSFPLLLHSLLLPSFYPCWDQLRSQYLSLSLSHLPSSHECPLPVSLATPACHVSFSIKLSKCLYKIPVYIKVIMGMGHTALWSQSDESINYSSEATCQ